MAIEPREFDVNGLYILVGDLGDTYRFHWALYLAIGTTSGDLFHAVNPLNKATWGYEVKVDTSIIDSRLLTAVKVGVIEPDLYDALRSRLPEIPLRYSARFNEDISCRIWVKEALFTLDNEGYIQLVKSVNSIEMEAKSEAMRNKLEKRTTVIKSVGSWE